jgi:hypothetical protein
LSVQLSGCRTAIASLEYIVSERSTAQHPP